MTTKPFAAAIAALVVCAAAHSAVAKDKPASATGLRAIQIDCMKQYGAYEDPQTHQLQLRGSFTDFQPKLDAIYACVAQKTGKPAIPFLRQETKYGP